MFIKHTWENKIDWPQTILMWVTIFVSLFVPFIFYYVSKTQAEVEARLLNQRYGTHYTVHDVFWAGDTIKHYLTMGPQSTYHINLQGASHE